MRKDIFTTGQVAEFCGVAPRTVSKWIDSGRLQGYRIPGSQDRRVPRARLLRFLKDHGMPQAAILEREDGRPTNLLIIGADSATFARIEAAMSGSGLELFRAAHPFEAGVIAGGNTIDAVLIDMAVGRIEAAMVVSHLIASLKADRPALLALSAATGVERAEYAGMGFDGCVSPSEVGSLLAVLENVRSDRAA